MPHDLEKIMMEVGIPLGRTRKSFSMKKMMPKIDIFLDQSFRIKFIKIAVIVLAGLFIILIFDSKRDDRRILKFKNTINESKNSSEK